jgi:hypothetical protein
MRCPLCGREMTKLGGPDVKKVSQPVYYCDKHGLLNKSLDAKAKTTENAKNPQWLRTD